MKSIRRITLACGCIALAMAAVSCASAPTVPYEYNKAVPKKEYGDPSDCALVYGSARQVKTVFNVLDAKRIDGLQLVQLNPKQKPMVITPARSGNHFFTEPLPVGSSLKFFYFVMQEGRTITYYYRGIQGKGPSDLRIEKPGLLYLGSLVYADKDYAEKKTITGRPIDYNSFDLYPAGDEKEIDALKSMLPKFKGTAWEPLIAERIEELDK